MSLISAARERPIFIKFRGRWHVIGKDLHSEMTIERIRGDMRYVSLGEPSPYREDLLSAEVRCFHRFRFFAGEKRCVTCSAVFDA